MTRLTKELKKKGIIHDTDDMQAYLYGTEYDTEEKLVGIFGGFIVTVWYSAAMDTELHIYDRNTFEAIGGQYLHKDRMFNGYSTWGSFAYAMEE